jgi:RNA polymerase sigma-70 factor (ECF subfamily)
MRSGQSQNRRHGKRPAAPYTRYQTAARQNPGAPVSAAILERIAAGDRAAVKECLDAYGDLVWSLARRFLKSQADAEDAVQDIFIDVWSHAQRYDPAKASETTFVATIARRRLIDRLRKQGRRPSEVDIDNVVLPTEDQPSDQPETGVETAIVARALATLRPEQQQAITLSVIEGYSHSDVAEKLQLPLGTVKTHIRRGLIRIREELASGQDPS